MAQFLADLPSSNPAHFSQLPDKELKAHEGSKVPKIAYHVPRRDSERIITNDKKPYILRFLERHYLIRNAADAGSGEDLLGPKKKRKSEGFKKRTSSDIPSTSSDPKTRRLN